MNELEALVKKHLKGGYEYEIFLKRAFKRKVEVSNEEPENLSASEEVGLSLRVLKDKRVGFAYLSSHREEDVKEAVLRATEMCELQKPDEGNAFPSEKLPPFAVSPYDEEGIKVPFEKKIETAVNMERFAKELDERVAGVRKATLSESEFSVHLVNSYGLEVSYKGTAFTASISVLAKEGEDGAIAWEFRGERFLSRLDWRDMVRDAVFKSTALLSPSPFETKSMPVVFFRDSFAMLVDAFSPMFLGDYLVKGKTLLKGKEGEKVASEKLSLVDDGTLEGGFYTFPYDAEGVPQRKTPLIEEGVFKGFLHSYATALKTGSKPTGNGVRNSYREAPSCGTTNLLVKAGKASLEELLSYYPEVFLVLEVMGLHTVDPISGEFSLGVSGLLYEEGKKVKSVRGITVAGNIMDVLRGVEEVGKDFKLYGGVGSPSVLVKSLTLGGR